MQKKWLTSSSIKPSALTVESITLRKICGSRLQSTINILVLLARELIGVQLNDKEKAAEVKRKLLGQKICPECGKDVPANDVINGDSYTDYRDVCYSCYGAVLSKVYVKQGRQRGE